MSAHTPGPWAGGLQISGPRGTIIAQVQTAQKGFKGYSNPNGAQDATAIANARLIAAAPDLLAALQDLIDVDSEEHAHNVSDDETHRADDCAFCAAVVAISKAEGRDA